MLRSLCLGVALVGLFAGCATSRQGMFTSRFESEASADVIIRYYTDATSSMLKPTQMEGEFQSLLSRGEVLERMRKVPGRDLAAIILVNYHSRPGEEFVMREWQKQLSELGFRQTVFLRGKENAKVNGMTIVPDPAPLTAFSGSAPPGS
jgi:hypothetical protein